MPPPKVVAESPVKPEPLQSEEDAIWEAKLKRLREIEAAAAERKEQRRRAGLVKKALDTCIHPQQLRHQKQRRLEQLSTKALEDLLNRREREGKELKRIGQERERAQREQKQAKKRRGHYCPNCDVPLENQRMKKVRVKYCWKCRTHWLKLA